MERYCCVLFLLVICTLHERVKSQTTPGVVDVRCTASYCGEWLNKNTCPPLDQECLEVGTMFVYPGECGCCEYCMKYLEEDAYCDIGQPGQPTSGSICGYGLTCTIVEGFDQAICKRLQSKCHSAQDQYDADKESGNLGHLRQRPACDEYGNYAPATCIPGSICYCTSPEGDRIFGEVAFDSPELQRTLNCKCSQDAWRASKLKIGADAIYPHCLQNGSYDPLQCVDNTCTCVDNEGIPSQARVHVADLNVSSPSCFSKDRGHKLSVYVRECEARRSDLLARQRTAMKANATVVLSDLPNCGLDGRYERLQVRGDMFICTDPDGKQIENFQQIKNRISINCNCARTRYTLRKAAEISGLSPVIPECCPNGNFKAWQCSRGVCYCVDPNGNQLYVDVAESKLDTLSCYKASKGNPCALVVPVTAS